LPAPPNPILSPDFETQAFLIHKTHQPSGLIVPSTRWHVFFCRIELRAVAAFLRTLWLILVLHIRLWQFLRQPR
jgi:hypothetical protein